MKKVMFVIGGLVGGGAERIVTTVASFLAETNEFDVSILTYYKDDNEYSFSSKIKRINISHGNRKDYNEMSAIKKMHNIRKEIKKYKPDDIICFLSHPTVFTFFSLFGSKFKKKIIYAERANPNYEKSKIGKMRNWVVKRINRIITQNNGQINCFKNGKHQIEVIPNPMYKELFENEKKYSAIPLKIVSVGRLTTQKNYDLSIRAFNEVQKKYKNLEYYIYGEGNQKEKLVELVKSLNLENKVHFMGFEMDRNKIYGDKDVYLMTSLFEGMPNTLAEAMCYGIPAISTNCDFGPSDLIMNEEMGILLKDYELSSVVEGLLKIVENYEKYVFFAKQSRKKLNDIYSYDKIMYRWKNYFM